MTGLDLESFLELTQADLSTWAVLGLASLGTVLVAWLCWGSRRVLRKCLVLSLAAHLGLAFYGSTVPAVIWAVNPDRRDTTSQAHIREIRVAPFVESAQPSAKGSTVLNTAKRPDNDRKAVTNWPSWDLANGSIGLEDSALHIDRPKFEQRAEVDPASELQFAGPVALPAATPKRPGRQPETAPLNPPDEPITKNGGNAPAATPLPPTMDEVARTSPSSEPVTEKESSRPGDFILQTDRRLHPDRSPQTEQSQLGLDGMTVLKPEGPEPSRAKTGTGSLTDSVTGKEGPGDRVPAPAEGRLAVMAPIPSTRATPRTGKVPGLASGLAALGDRGGGHSLADIPKIYQPRLDPDRFSRAQRIGASTASQLAVERALDWLARHQDREDGRWDGGIARYQDGTPVKGDNNFTVHCPPGETCFGECAYWEADTALTGLALLTYLGAGYTQIEGRYAETVKKGLDFLIVQQKPDGDLRGQSRVVGMYCHAMATLALCEAYALTRDARLRDPGVRAVAFLSRGRARDGLAWRYAPGAPIGDTSILGWIVMGLKSAKEVGIPIPDELSIRQGTLGWLDKVAVGQSKGLACYQPGDKETPTMTAEAWVCRQFLGVGGPGPASTEAADFLLREENESDRGPSNFYYWYYATLALYQHGGEPWSRWNDKVRDRIVKLQRDSGHQIGSWDPDGSLYGNKGGRIYCTTLAAMTLEVYYRYLRLYDEPKIPLEAGRTLDLEPGSLDGPLPAKPTTNPEDQ